MLYSKKDPSHYQELELKLWYTLPVLADTILIVDVQWINCDTTIYVDDSTFTLD